jgi:hypothetical protein
LLNSSVESLKYAIFTLDRAGCPVWRQQAFYCTIGFHARNLHIGLARDPFSSLVALKGCGCRFNKTEYRVTPSASGTDRAIATKSETCERWGGL